MYVARRQRDSTIENSQEAMIRVATINCGSFHPLLFSCVSRTNGFLIAKGSNYSKSDDEYSSWKIIS